MNAAPAQIDPMDRPVGAMTPLSEFAAKRRGSVDPKKYPEEIFDLFSIPAYDSGKPDRVVGSDIGSTKKIVEPGDVLISRIVPHIQRVWVVPEAHGKRQIASGEWIVFKDNRVVPEFLRHMLLAKPFHEQFMQTVAGMGGSLLRARPKEVERIEIPVPTDPDEQRRIAAILDKADAIRRKREQALALADDLLKSTFLEMFGDPNTNPFDFPVRPLKNHADVKIGYPFQSKNYSESGIRLCRGANTLPSRLDWSDVRYWPENERSEFSDYQLAEGDVILALDRPWISSGLKVAQVSASDLPALLVQRVARIRCVNRAVSDFIYLALNHKSFWAYCKPTETTVPHISPVELRDYPLIDPGPKRIQEFGKRVQSLSSITSKLNRELVWSENLFASLSQRAFRGEL